MYAGFRSAPCEGERWRCAARRRDRRETEKHVGPDDCGIRGDQLTLIVPDNHLGLAIAERIDERDLIAHHVEREERRGVRLPGFVPANRAAKPAAVRSDHVIASVRDRRHDLAPAVAQVRKTVEQQHQGPALRSRCDHVHGESIDVRHQARSDSGRKGVVAVRRQLLERRHCRDLRPCGGRERHASERRSTHEKVASRESGRCLAFHVSSWRDLHPHAQRARSTLLSPVRRTPAPASFRTDRNPPCRLSPRLLAAPRC